MEKQEQTEKQEQIENQEQRVKQEQIENQEQRVKQEQIEKQEQMKKQEQIEKQEKIETDQEVNYQKAVRFMKSIRCMTAQKEKLEMYQQATKQFKTLSGYKDSDVLVNECKLLIKQTKKDIKKAIYKRAKNRKELAKYPEDYNAAAEEFRKISGFRDSDTMALECDKMCGRMERRMVRTRMFHFGFAIFCFVIIVFIVTSSYSKYLMAGVYRLTNSYSSAIHLYQNLGEYKDSEVRLVECQYLNGIALNELGDYKNAAKSFAAAENYKDSELQKVESEKQMIINCQPGDMVWIGNYSWVILQKDEGEALLLKKSALDAMPYHNRSEGVTWHQSTLRSWLNSDFITDTFSESERNHIMQETIINEDNDSYGTEGGSDTQDYIFLLSIEEAKKYSSMLPALKSNSWLRSPGGNSQCAAFLSVDGSIMTYGYEATSKEMSIRPAMWFNFR